MNDTIALAIGGLDPSGGAGLPADMRAMGAFGVHCCTVTTAVIAQNTCGVARIEPVSPEMLAAQLDNLLEDITPQAIKIGMIPTKAAAQIIVSRLEHLRHLPIVVDTVFAPSSGPRFSPADTITYMANHLLRLAELVTPNIPEAIELTQQPIADYESMIAAARIVRDRCKARHVLVKGGHWPQSFEAKPVAPLPDAVDVLWDGEHAVELRAPRIGGYEVRGTGCLLASAIAAQQARGVPLQEATKVAKKWLTEQIRQATPLGQGRRVATLIESQKIKHESEETDEQS